MPDESEGEVDEAALGGQGIVWMYPDETDKKGAI